MAGALLAALWLGVTLMPQAAQAAPDELACPVGTQQSGGLCYPICRDGYVGEGPICWQKCPAGQTDDGTFCRKDAQIVAKQSYTRGVGSALVCAANQEGQGGLRYTRCTSAIRAPCALPSRSPPSLPLPIAVGVLRPSPRWMSPGAGFICRAFCRTERRATLLLHYLSGRHLAGNAVWA